MWTSVILIAGNLALSVTKSLLAIWKFCIARALLTSGVLILLNAHWQFGNILLLSRNDRVGNFYWIRGSQHCFLTSCSYLNHYFLFLVFSRNRYLLVSLHLSWPHGDPTSCPVFSYLWYSEVLCCTCAPIFFGTHHVFS